MNSSTFCEHFVYKFYILSIKLDFGIGGRNMNIKDISKKGLVICVVCIMMLVYIPSINGISVEDKKKEVLTNGGGTVKSGFIIGPYESSSWDGDLLVLIANFQHSPAKSLNFLVPFRRGIVFYTEQIKLVQFNNCIIMKNFIIGFCKIYMSQAEVSMHILSQNDEENEVIWVVDGINGDKIWERNIDCELYTESGSQSHDGWTNGPYLNEYLSIGDQISIKSHTDGYYSVKFIESISKDILFESPLVKY